ncbi:hypothetical protein [Leucobacter sp. PH1c]|nr:hypothetical protein [Leucobacter sp. PH1c]
MSRIGGSGLHPEVSPEHGVLGLFDALDQILSCVLCENAERRGD